MIKEIKGNLFKSDVDVLVHGCNCWNTFGAGIALQVAKLYPEAYDEDLKTIRGDKNKLGTYTKWTGKNFYNERDVTIINAYTQYYANAKIKPLDYDALEKVMIKIKKDFKDNKIAMPKIGAGLAGGDWNKISAIINNVFNEKEILVYALGENNCLN